MQPRLSDVKRHSASKKHMEITKAKSLQPAVFQVPVEPGVIAIKKRRELRFALFAACKTSFRAMDPLCELLQNEFGKDTIDLHRSKCAALVKKVLGPHFEAELKKDLKGMPFSLMPDESTDCSTTKLLAVAIRYFSKSQQKIITTFLDMIEIEEGTAEALEKAILELLKKWELKGNDFVGLATDGASAMIGVDNSLQSRLKEHFPHLVHVRCVCHSIDNAAKQACKQELPSNLEPMMRETFNWFCHSAQRKKAYQDLIEKIKLESLLEEGESSKPVLKLVSLSCTRWLVIFDALDRILSQYKLLKQHFSDVAEKDRCYDARHLSEMYNDNRNYIFLLFLYPILKELKELSNNFQTKTLDCIKVFQSLKVYFRSLATKLLKPVVLANNDDEHLATLNLSSDFCFLETEDLDLGRTFLRELAASNIPTEEKNIIKIRAKKFLINLLRGLQKRVRGCLGLADKLTCVSYPNCLHDDFASQDLTPFFPSDPLILCEIEEKQKLLKQIQWKSSSTEEFWLEAHCFKNALGVCSLQPLTKRVIRILVLPISNAEVERCFSQLNLIKEDKRSWLKTASVTAIMQCRFGLSRTDTKLSQFIPPSHLLNFDSSIYEK